MTNKPIDKIVLAVVVLLLVCVAVLNLCQTERPTVSVTENRNLATMPEFSVSTLLSGEYFAGISDFISDTFLGRDAMVAVSQKIDTLKSLSLIYEREGISVIIDPNSGNKEEPEELLTLPTLPPPPTTPQNTEAPPETTVGTTPPETTVGTTPPETTSPETTPPETTPPETTPPETTPPETTPPETTPPETTPPETTPPETTPPETTPEPTVPNIETPQTKPVDFLPNGMIIYDGAAHSQSYFSEELAPSYAQLYETYTQHFPASRMSVVIGPLSTITITDPAVSKHISDQGSILDRTQATITGNVNFVNLKNVFLQHANEYLFFKSDHHWTHRGAYYAYSEFIKSVGMSPVPIDAFQKKILNDGYIGSMYNYTGDDRVGSFYDTIEAYMPTKACSMQIFFGDGSSFSRDSCIMADYSTYVAFICGDNPYTVINVPENPQDKSILVIKDSFGNAFVTYLAEHYGNIVVIDPRHANMNIHDFYDQYNFTDIVFMVNSSSSNTPAWYNYLASLLS